MERENIIIEDTYSNKRLILSEGDDVEDDSEFDYITEDHSYTDGEKAISYFTVIVKRKSDKKFFAFEKVKGSAGYKETNFQGREVFPKTKTITIYE